MGRDRDRPPPGAPGERERGRAAVGLHLLPRRGRRRAGAARPASRALHGHGGAVPARGDRDLGARRSGAAPRDPGRDPRDRRTLCALGRGDDGGCAARDGHARPASRGGEAGGRGRPHRGHESGPHATGGARGAGGAARRAQSRRRCAYAAASAARRIAAGRSSSTRAWRAPSPLPPKPGVGSTRGRSIAPRGRRRRAPRTARASFELRLERTRNPSRGKISNRRLETLRRPPGRSHPAA